MFRFGDLGHILARPIANSIMQPRIYTYKITFEEVPYWYWGVHKEKKFGEKYLGSPSTHKWAWEFYTPKVQILELFAYSSEGWEQARQVEKRLIMPDLNNSFCLNQACGCVFSLEATRRVGNLNVALKRGFWKEGMKEIRQTALRKLIKERRGIFDPEFQRLNGIRTYEEGRGIFNPIHQEKIKEAQVKCGKKQGPLAAAKLMAEKKGIHNPELQHLKKEWGAVGGRAGGNKGGKIVNEMRFMNTDERFPAHVSTPAGLTNWQKARGIDPKNRVRVN